MLSSRPYLLRALYEWIIDNSMTPQVLIDSSREGVTVPDGSSRDGKVVLNIAPDAVRDLEIDGEYLSCLARFGGVSHGVVVPVDAVLAIYARENGQGMMFPDTEDEGPDEQDESADDGEVKPPRKKPNLKVIK